MTGNIYEPLVTRGADFKLTAALATDWKQTAPTVWRFNLRKNVQFHDGTPFTADDVIFSYDRARGEGSDVKIYVGQINRIDKIDDHTIDIVTKQPLPILPDIITNWYMMSKKWCEENQATRIVDRRKGHRERSFVPHKWHRPVPRARSPNVRSVFTRSTNYWGKIDSNVDEVVFNVIGNDFTRVAACCLGRST